MDINRYVEQMKDQPGAVLVDVRTPQEYAGGHIPGSVNWPLERISLFDLEGERFYLYCHSGARSARAAAWLAQNGYEDVTSIGGILDWKGEIEK